MIEPTLVKKLRLTAGQKVAILNAPDTYLPLLTAHAPFPLTPDSSITDPPYDLIQIFVVNRAMVERWAEMVTRSLVLRGLAWFTYPKRSGPLRSDLARDSGWETLATFEWEFVTLISLNETWSAHLYRQNVK